MSEMLTGNTRYRASKAITGFPDPKLILQVEVRRESEPSTDDVPGYSSVQVSLSWRDAKVEDLAVLESLKDASTPSSAGWRSHSK